MNLEYTRRELELIKKYERRKNTLIGNREYRQNEFDKMNSDQLHRFKNGVSTAIYNRLNLDNVDAFDSEDDIWKLKVLRENVGIIEKILMNRK